MENKRKKGIAPPRYDEAFKAGAIRMVTEQGRPSTEAAKELGICIDTLRSWLKATGVQGVSAAQADIPEIRLILLSALRAGSPMESACFSLLSQILQKGDMLLRAGML